MKLHPTLLEKLLQIYEINAGWQEQKKLRAALQNFDASVYTQQNGTQVLVETAELNKHKAVADRKLQEQQSERMDHAAKTAEKINRG
tara:strand:- start:94 stop:354 length:261 start_codon:yes stop_codon:yes gene_type:complete